LFYNAFKILVGNPRRKRPLEVLIFMWENNIKIYLEIKCEGVDWTNLSNLTFYDCDYEDYSLMGYDAM
jgi:hypothetical protein